MRIAKNFPGLFIICIVLLSGCMSERNSSFSVGGERLSDSPNDSGNKRLSNSSIGANGESLSKGSTEVGGVGSSISSTEVDSGSFKCSDVMDSEPYKSGFAKDGLRIYFSCKTFPQVNILDVLTIYIVDKAENYPPNEYLNPVDYVKMRYFINGSIMNQDKIGKNMGGKVFYGGSIFSDDGRQYVMKMEGVKGIVKIRTPTDVWKFKSYFSDLPFELTNDEVFFTASSAAENAPKIEKIKRLVVYPFAFEKNRGEQYEEDYLKYDKNKYIGEEFKHPPIKTIGLS
jgi:hypothetical protein